MSDPRASDEADVTPQSAPRQLPLREQKWVIVMAACIAGAMIGYGLAGFAPKPPDWKRDAAQHHALYRGWTIVPASPAPAKLEADLASASTAIGTPLSLATTTAEKSLVLKRVQVLGVGEAQLVQILYAAPGGTPVALYAIKRRSNSKWTLSELAPERGVRNGLASATWSTETVDLMLIGGDSQNGINALADGLRSRIFREGQS